jgi:hypothetical protein
VEGTLRLYANPLKLAFSFVFALVCVAAVLLLLQVPAFRADVGRVGMAYFGMTCFGLFAVVFLMVFLRVSVTRQPMLQVDVQGWTHRPAFGFRSQRIGWPDIARVAIYRELPWTNRKYYLVVDTKHADMMPHTVVHSMNVALYPSLSRAVLFVPLNAAFVRVTPAQVEGLLRDIQAKFAVEIRGYGIAVADEIQEM